MMDCTEAVPLVSVIKPCFYSKETVGDAIEYALSQSYLNWKVFMIDDGSTDDSLQVVRGFKKTVRWETGEDRGGAAARKRGLELAEGVFIQFLDADDMLLRGKLECHVRAPH